VGEEALGDAERSRRRSTGPGASARRSGRRRRRRRGAPATGSLLSRTRTASFGYAWRIAPKSGGQRVRREPRREEHPQHPARLAADLPDGRHQGRRLLHHEPAAGHEDGPGVGGGHAVARAVEEGRRPPGTPASRPADAASPAACPAAAPAARNDPTSATARNARSSSRSMSASASACDDSTASAEPRTSRVRRWPVPHHRWAGAVALSTGAAGAASVFAALGGRADGRGLRRD
jgi:hypothetical protein